MAWVMVGRGFIDRSDLVSTQHTFIFIVATDPIPDDGVPFHEAKRPIVVTDPNGIDGFLIVDALEL